jgi:hypothetical protein
MPPLVSALKRVTLFQSEIFSTKSASLMPEHSRSWEWILIQFLILVRGTLLTPVSGNAYLGLIFLRAIS